MSARQVKVGSHPAVVHRARMKFVGAYVLTFRSCNKV
jgi:hypothetical protein